MMETKTKALKRALIYIPITLFIALFSFIYELNGHGVYSKYMIYAFAPTMVGGVIFWFLVMMINRNTSLHNSSAPSSPASSAPSVPASTASPASPAPSAPSSSASSATSLANPSPLFINLWTALIATLTVGMIFKGALDIYGTSSRLTNIYWVASIILLILCVISILPKKQK